MYIQILKNVGQKFGNPGKASSKGRSKGMSILAQKPIDNPTHQKVPKMFNRFEVTNAPQLKRHLGLLKNGVK